MTTTEKQVEIDALVARANDAATRIKAISEDMILADDYIGVEEPQPKWWWRFSPAARQRVGKWMVMKQIREDGPGLLNIARNDLREAVDSLKGQHRLLYSYTESPTGIRWTLTSMGSKQVVQASG